MEICIWVWFCLLLKGNKSFTSILSKSLRFFLSLKHTSCLAKFDINTRIFFIFQNNSHIVITGYSSISDHIIYLLKYTFKSHVIVLLGIVSKTMPSAMHYYLGILNCFLPTLPLTRCMLCKHLQKRCHDSSHPSCFPFICSINIWFIITPFSQFSVPLRS